MTKEAMGRTTVNAFENGFTWVANYQPGLATTILDIGSRTGWEVLHPSHHEVAHAYEHFFLKGTTLLETLSDIETFDRRGVFRQASTTRNYVDLRMQGPIRSTRFMILKAYRSVTKRGFDAAETDKERMIIDLETRQGENDPELSDAWRDFLYAGTQYAICEERKQASLKKICPEKLDYIVDRLFSPSNMVLVTVSGIRDAKLQKAIEPFKNLKPRKVPKHPEISLPARKDLVVDNDERSEAGLCYVEIVLRAFAPNNKRIKDLAALYVISEVLAGRGIQIYNDILGGDSSYLTKYGRHMAGIFYSPACYISPARPEITVNILYACLPENLKRAQNLVHEILDCMVNNKSLSAREGQPRSKPLSVENIAKFASLSRSLLRAELENPYNLAKWLFENEVLEMSVKPVDFLQMISEVTPRDIQRMMREIYLGTVSHIQRVDRNMAYQQEIRAAARR